ncbi:MAG: hypothetical protein DMD76_31315, partial [Candidatus Rokuibacteriota bacterium]
GTVGARAALVHPQSRACTTGGAGEWWTESVTRQAKEPIPARYKWTIKPLPTGEPPPFGDKFDYPILPTHALQLDMQPEPYHFRRMLVQLARAGDHWAEVVPCAKPEIQAAIRAALAAKAKRAQRVEALVAAMPPALRDTVLAQIKAGRQVEAAQSYARASGEDLTTATEVVDRLAEGAR